MLIKNTTQHNRVRLATESNKCCCLLNIIIIISFYNFSFAASCKFVCVVYKQQSKKTE